MTVPPAIFSTAKEIKSKLDVLDKLLIVTGILGCAISVLSSMLFFINWDVIPGEAVGPHPAAGDIGGFLIFISLCMNGIVGLAGLVSLIFSLFKKSRGISALVALAIMGLAYAGLAICLITINRVKSANVRSYVFSLDIIGDAMSEYAQKNDGLLPPSDKWCDYMVKCDSSIAHSLNNEEYDNPENLSNYAFNNHLSEMKLLDVPNDVVLVFETSLARNPSGGRELMETLHHRGKGCFVLFSDMHIEFVRVEDFNDLRWKP